ncbi:class I SAM-dependent methyltransferase [Candidatus Stoquefichus massiliensis]|uniref:class I SAM-dependent methyltransferase n=1 Tax=Candidatus Stoquefichus massiliensis TaxID=1470350 RepID=UPI000488AFD0|nr:class I SAM-dependent methyltransferase [Candidatus Stoquefichus massiliensis]
MKNPWQDISLDDYENHMQLETVQQLSELNKIMKKQFSQYSIETLMILGVAGGNGLEHISPDQVHKVYGVDINQDYLVQCQQRYDQLETILECICTDLCSEGYQLPHVDLVVANLLIEYIGYTCFQRVLQNISPQFVSCVIQINPNEEFVSNSPFTHVFEHLDEVHHQLEEIQLIQHMKDIHYEHTLKEVTLLPDGKQLLRLDFVKQNTLFDRI